MGSAAHAYVEQRKKRAKFGLADAHAYAAAKRIGAELVTCDSDFQGMDGVVLL